MELYERIRKDNRDEGLSIRALADEYRCAPSHGARGVGFGGAAGA